MVMYVVNKYNLLNTTLPDIDKTLTEFVRFEADNQKTKIR